MWHMSQPARRASPSVRPVRRARRGERLSLRASADQVAAIRAAAEAKGISLTDFVLDHAMVAAERVLADRVHLTWSVEDFERFVEILDRPVQDKPKLRELLSRPSTFGS
jgi:uncharacterized protein (DUF1778 family)